LLTFARSLTRCPTHIVDTNTPEALGISGVEKVGGEERARQRKTWEQRVICQNYPCPIVSVEARKADLFVAERAVILLW
jgi:hypothetical protein